MLGGAASTHSSSMQRVPREDHSEIKSTDREAIIEVEINKLRPGN